jgi:hypothetical protein
MVPPRHYSLERRDARRGARSVGPRIRHCVVIVPITPQGPVRYPGRGLARAPLYSPLGLRPRDQMRVKVSPSSSLKRLA